MRIAALPAERTDDAVALLGRAFMPDPIFCHYYPDPSRRSAMYAVFFAMLLRVHSRFGHVYGAEHDGALRGVAVWRPPETGALTEQDWAPEREAWANIRAIDPVAAEALDAGFARTDADHPHEPHWYLFFVGVEPVWQSHGIGQQLLAPVLQAADAAGVPCYLETATARTHRFYQRLGFHIRSAGHPFTGAPMLWTMLRRPTPGIAGGPAR